MPHSARGGRAVSLALVALQMGALATLVWPWTASRFASAGWLPIAAAIALAGWTLAHNRPGNFSVLPEPRRDARLVTTGPYARMRHPMYVAVMLFAVGCALGWTTPLHGIAAAALVVVLNAKARLEEALLGERFADYARYAARTPRFLPHVGPAHAGHDDTR